MEKPNKTSLLVLDIIMGAATIALVSYGVWVATTPKQSDDTCSAPGRDYSLDIKEGAFTPDKLEVTRCDNIKITNTGTDDYELAFGVHEQHITYPGFDNEKILKPTETVTIQAVKAGDYTLHDHIRDQAKLDLIIHEKQ